MSSRLKSDPPARQALAPQSAQRTACPAQPATAAAGDKDGRFPLQADASGLLAPDIASFLILGKEAAAAGRTRDAESAFLMSCRVATNLKGADSLEAADAKYQLGSHYARVAAEGGPSTGVGVAELRKRAELLYADSMQVYLAKYGPANEKSRFAAEGLAALRQTQPETQTQAQAGSAQQLPALSQAVVPEPAGRGAQPVPSAAGAGPGPGPILPVPPQVARAEAASPPSPLGRQPAAARFRPSFDCARARSTPERLICSDAQLAQLDRELGRIYARAKVSTADRAAFRRTQDAEWRRREATCRDRGCLLNWYAQRRDQLLGEIARNGQTGASRANSSPEIDRFYRGN